MRQILPFGMDFQVHRASNALLDAWKGAALWCRSPESANGFLTKEKYMEAGHEYFQEHTLSNKYFRSFSASED